ncbi:MAG: hypothetical protein ACRCVU_14125 [Flavobacterium sp.]
MIQLIKKGNDVDVSKDSIVILLNTYTLEGGRVLDVTGFAPNAIQAGHIVIRENATGTYKPMPISGEEFGELPADHKFAGIVVASVDKVTQGGGVGVMVQGAVNKKAMPYKIPTALEAGLKTALNQIYFSYDNK